MPAKKKTAATGERKQRQNLGGAARARAIQRLIEEYPNVWAEILGEEREKVGLSAEGRRVTRLQKFVAAMKAAGVESEEIEKALVEAGFKKGSGVGQEVAEEE